MDTSHYSQKLQEEKSLLEKELNSLGVHNPKVPEDWIPTPGEPVETEPDPNIQADRSEDWGERRGTLDVLETRLNNINRALTKIENGTFGVCELCQQTIENDRLEANPAARTCKSHIEDESLLP